MKKTTVTIGVSAYECESNITTLLKSLLDQSEKKLSIEMIIVYCDGCTDRTPELVRNIKSKKIKLIDSRENNGYAHSVQSILDMNKSDVVVLLNDDIKIKSNKLVENLVAELEKDEEIEFVCGDIVPLKPRTFIEKCVYSSFLAFQPIRYNHREGKSPYTVDGKIMALGKRIAGKLNLNEVKNTGNVDIFIYFSTLYLGYKYSFAEKAKVYYRLPATIFDYRNQQERTKKSKIILRKHFGDIVPKEFKLPIITYIGSILKIFIQYPLESIVFKFIINNIYFLGNEKSFKKWNLAKSTKEL